MAQATLPRRSTDILPVVTLLLFWNSSHRLNNIGPSLVHDNALSCLHPRTHLSTTSTPTCVECAFRSLRTHQSSASQLSKACLSNACGLCDHRVTHPWKSRRRLEQCSTGQDNSGLRDSKVIPDRCARLSPLLLLSPWGEASGTISPCQQFLTASQKAPMLGSRSDFRTIRLYPMKSKSSIRALAGCGCTTPFDGIG